MSGNGPSWPFPDISLDLSAELDIGDVDGNDKVADRDWRMWVTPRILQPKFVINAVNGLAMARIGEGPNTNRKWDIRRFVMGNANPVAGQVLSPPTSVYGTATAPVANAVVAGTANLQPGTYQVTVNAWYGSPTDTIADNMKLVISGFSTITQLEVPVTANGPSVSQTMTVFVQNVAGIQVQAVANATAGAIYKARIDVTPVNNNSISINTYLFRDVGSGRGLVNASSFEAMEMLWWWPTFPIAWSWPRDTMTISEGEDLIVVVLASGPFLASGNVQVVDKPIFDTTPWISATT